MKIQSIKENSKRLGSYKQHESTPVHKYGLNEMVKGLFVGSSYIPTPSCPPYAEPAFNLVLGMDNRRYVLNLSFDEAAKLKNELDYHLNQLSLRRLK